MRQGQQTRRGRGRGRKVQNPLARNFESNGPDVKIRGNATHIAEKYATLARDAAASGDIVTAENYLQHAEHYNRIIMAAQTQFTPGGPQPSDNANGSGGPRQHRGTDGGRGPMTAYDDDGDDSGDAPASEDAPAAAAADDAAPPSRGRKPRRSNGSDGESDSDAQGADEDTDNAMA